MSRGQPQFSPLMQTHFPTAWVTPGPSGQSYLNLGLTTLGIDQSHLGFAVLPSALVAIAHPVPGDDSNATRGVRLTNASSLDMGHTPTPVRTDDVGLLLQQGLDAGAAIANVAADAVPPGAFTAMTPAVESVDRYAEHHR